MKCMWGMSSTLHSAKLLTRNATAIKEYDKKVHDYHTHACLCCEQMFKRSQVAKVDLTTFKENPVWLQICAYALLTNPDVGRDPVFLCDYCRPKVKSGIMPGRCALNGLQTEPLQMSSKVLTHSAVSSFS